MKPGFALSLSSAGITLLHRAAGGWRNVGHVALDAEDLPGALAGLRELGLQLLAPDAAEPRQVACKLVIPNDQIRYLTLDTSGADPQTCQDMAYAALEGATPYAVDDLAFDLAGDGAQTHVAAVALETLDEAETFAVDHGFLPVSFVAVPGEMAFLGEPFFGTTRSIRGTEVEPDGIAVVDIGPAEVPQPLPETSEEAEPEANSAETEPAEPEAVSAEPEAAEEAEPELPVLQPEAEETTASEAEPELAAESADEAAPAQEVAADETAAPVPASSPSEEAPAAAEQAAEDAAPGNKNAEGDALGGETEASEEPAPEVAPIGFTSRRNKTARTAAAPAGAKDAGTGPAPVDQSPKDRGAKPADPGKAAASAPAAPKAEKEPAAAAPPIAAVAVPPPGGDLTARQTSAAIPRAPAAIRAPSREAASEPDISSIIAKSTAGSTRGKPRYLGLILTAGLLFAMAVVAAWAMLPGFGFFQKELETPAPEPQSELIEPVQDAEEQNGGEVQPVQTAIEPPAADPSDEQAIAPQVSALSGQPDPGVTELEPAGQPDARSEATADTASLEDAGEAPAAALPLAEQTADSTDPAEAAEAAEIGGQIDPEAIADGAVPEPQPAEDSLPQAARYAATGIWQTPPQGSQPPAETDLEGVYVASIDNTDLSQDAVALPLAPSFDTDTALAAISSPTAHGSAFELDERGLVTATPEGTLNPDGVMVFLGRPKVVPPAPPNRPDPEAEAAEANAERLAVLARKRPRARPDDLVEQAERARLGGLSREELASLRPRARPASLKTEAEESQPATAQAVPKSVLPRARPANFANLVDRARRSQQTAAAVPAATVTPRIPSSASVARQATLNNAINLRRLNLIGVFGSASDRRALVRLPSGRYKKVKVGDRIDGGKVVAIGDSQLQYQKQGRNMTLKIPNG